MVDLTPLLQFIHGLVFFILGVVIFFLAPRAARMEIARRLPLLAVFAFSQAVVAWDGVLACSLGLEQLLPSLARAFLLGTGYLCMLVFALLAAVPPGPGRNTRVTAAIFMGSGWLLSLLVLLLVDQAVPRVAMWGEILAAVGFALPGGILTTWGLRREAYRTLDLQMLRRVKLPLRITGVTLGVFGIAVSLEAIAGPVDFPFSVLYTVCGISLIVSITWALNVVQSEIERWIEGVEQSQALAADRERISRELHDGIIQAIYAAGLMLEGVAQTIHEDPEAADVQLARAMTSLNQTIQDIRRYIFNLRGEVPESDLQSGLEQLLRDFRINTLLETELRVEGEEKRVVRAEQRGHIFQIVREALSNTARHARARKVHVDVTFRPDSLCILIADDGVGMDRTPIRGGQGLRNIQERVRLLDGDLQIDSAPGEGVTLTLMVPY